MNTIVSPTETSQPRATVAVSTLNLIKTYGSGPQAVRAVDGISVAIATGSFTAIMGPSGSGKSTLMHCMAGLDTITDGRVFLGGQRDQPDAGHRADPAASRPGSASSSSRSTCCPR